MSGATDRSATTNSALEMPFRLRIGARPGDETCLTFHANHRRGPARQGQREVAEAAVQVQDPVGGRDLQ